MVKHPTNCRLAVPAAIAIAMLALGSSCGQQPSAPAASSGGFTPVAPERLNVGEFGRSSSADANGGLLVPASVHADFPEERSAAQPLGFMRVTIQGPTHEVSVHGALRPGDINRRDGLSPYFHGFELGGELFVTGFLGVPEHGRDAWQSHRDDGVILRLIDGEWERVAVFDCEPLGIVSVVPLNTSSVMLVGVCGDNTQPSRQAPPIVLQLFDGQTLTRIDHELEGELIGAVRSGEHVYVATTNRVRAYSTLTREWTDVADVGSPQTRSGTIRAIAPYNGGVAIGGGFVHIDGVAGFGNVALLRVGEPPTPLGRIGPHHAALRETLGSSFKPVEALCVLADGRVVAGGANPMRLATYDEETGEWRPLDGTFAALDDQDIQHEAVASRRDMLSVVTTLHAFPNEPAVLLNGLGPERFARVVDPDEEIDTAPGRAEMSGGDTTRRVLPPFQSLLVRFEDSR